MITPNDPVSPVTGSTGTSGQFDAPGTTGQRPSAEGAPAYPSPKKPFPKIIVFGGITLMLLAGGGAAFMIITGRGIPLLTKDGRSQRIPVTSADASTSDRNVVSLGHFTLNGIIYSRTTPVAIINGRSCREGEVVDGAYVTAINPDAVVITSNDREYTLRLQ